MTALIGKWDREKYFRFKLAYIKAIRDQEPIFEFEGYVFVVSFANIIIQKLKREYEH